MDFVHLLDPVNQIVVVDPHVLDELLKLRVECRSPVQLPGCDFSLLKSVRLGDRL